MKKHRVAAWIEKHMTQRAFADRVKCSDSHLSLILNGERGASYPLAKRMSEVTGIPIDVIFEEKIRLEKKVQRVNAA